MRISCLVGSRDNLQFYIVEIQNISREVLRRDLVTVIVSEVGGLWYPHCSALSCFRSISSLAEGELHHRDRIHDNSIIQASLHVKSAVKIGFWPFWPGEDVEVAKKGQTTKPKQEQLPQTHVQMILSLLLWW